MNDTELLAQALRRRDERIKACLASTTSDRKAATFVAFVLVFTVASVLLF
jgi:hypothetical protein